MHCEINCVCLSAGNQRAGNQRSLLSCQATTVRQVVGESEQDGVTWMATQEEPEKKRGDAQDDDEARSSREASDGEVDEVDVDEEEDENDDDDEEEEDEEEEDEEEEDGDEDGEAADDREAADGDEAEPSVLTQASEKEATTKPSPPKRRTRARAAVADAEVQQHHTASQPTLAAHGHVWAVNCRSALAKGQRKDWAGSKEHKEAGSSSAGTGGRA